MSISQNNITKGTTTVLPDFDSVANILSNNLIRNQELGLHDVPEGAYSLKAANGPSTTVHYETSFIMTFSLKLTLHIICLVSNDLTSSNIMISWFKMSN